MHKPMMNPRTLTLRRQGKCERKGKRKQRAILRGQGKEPGLKGRTGEGGYASLSDDIAKCKSGFL